MNMEEVAQNFSIRKINSRSRTVSWSAGNVFCDGDLIFSYGSHFPMAKFLGDHPDKPSFIRNGDKYSSSTSHHQSTVAQACGGPVVSRTMLSKYGIDFTKITAADIVCFRLPFHKFCYRDKKTDKYFEEAHTRRGDGWNNKVDSSNEFFVGAFEDKLVEGEWTPPGDGDFVPCYKRGGDSKERIVSGSWRIAAAVMLKHKRSHYFCSTDYKDSMFVTRVPKTVATITDGFAFLKEKK
jgi:hypothetical protein